MLPAATRAGTSVADASACRTRATAQAKTPRAVFSAAARTASTRPSRRASSALPFAFGEPPRREQRGDCDGLSPRGACGRRRQGTGLGCHRVGSSFPKMAHFAYFTNSHRKP
jgi:hypothetical protein